MKYITSIFLFILACTFPNEKCWGQCDFYQINHFSGTELIGGCTNVTVTLDGGVFSSPVTNCGYSPYWIGHIASGSVLFQFSQPIDEARISLTSLDNWAFPYKEEVVSFEVNGAPYPLTNPGTHQPGCDDNSLFINADGNIASNVEGHGSWENIIITESMTSLKVSDIWLGGLPNGVVVRVEICCAPLCTTEAGMLTASPIEICEDEPAIFAPPVQTVLDGDDLLEYILFSDLLDTLGSIITTSLTPQFTFDPSTMSAGVTYYIAVMAGNNVGGSIDPADPCLDISNAIEVIWHPLPTVSFSVPSPDVCVDDCIDITVSLTGSPPFQLTAEAASGGSVVVTINETISGSTAILPLCVPSGTSIGDLTLTATVLVDNFCTCN